jgi:hypothetical protein
LTERVLSQDDLTTSNNLITTTVYYPIMEIKILDDIKT